MNRRRLTAVLVAVVAGTAIGLGLADVSLSTGKVVPPVTPDIAALKAPQDVSADPGVREIAGFMRGRETADLARARTLQRGLGRYDSRLILVPSRSGRALCYGLAGRSPTDPGSAYCYQPGDPAAPRPLLGQRFHATALYSNFDGEPRIQVYGIAFDDVSSMRIEVSGAWQDVPLANNGFYLDLPSVTYDDLGQLDATLTDGTVQTHDLRQGG